MPLTYEQLKPALFKNGAKFANRDFDMYELISEAWLNKNVRSIEHGSLAMNAVKWAVIAYMKQQTGSWRKGWWKKAERIEANCSYSESTKEDWLDYLYDDRDIAFEIDSKDLMERLMHLECENRAKLCCWLWLHGATQKEIGDRLGIHRERAGQLSRKTLNILRTEVI